MDERLVRLECELRWWRILVLVVVCLAVLGAAGQGSQEVRLVSPDGKRTVVLNADGLVFLGEKRLNLGLIAHHQEGQTAGLVITDPATGKERVSITASPNFGGMLLKDDDAKQTGAFLYEDGISKVQVGRGTNVVSIGATKDAALVIVDDGSRSATLVADQIIYKSEPTPEKKP